MNNKITSRMCWAIFCLSKFDVRNAQLSLEQAGSIIDGLKAGGELFNQAVETLKNTEGAIAKGDGKPKEDWRALYNEAHSAGMAAGTACVPRPMIVSQHANMADDRSPVVASEFVADGVCGFAFVTVFPGTCSFARWAKKNNLARAAYRGGMQFWVSYFGQSMAKKEAYAYAFADVLQKHDIKAYAGSRMD